ncbi:MAG: arsenate reductase ArsC [Rhodoferax sp.]
MLLNEALALGPAPVRGRTVTVLVLCTGNSARSIMAEALFRHLGAPWIRAFSAGSRPVGKVNPYALEQIRTQLRDDGTAYYSKGWGVFAASASAMPIDIVLTVCANAAREPCPVFPGAGARVHWEFPDPAAAGGQADAMRAAFGATFAEMRRRVESLTQGQWGPMSAQQTAEALQVFSAQGER